MRWSEHWIRIGIGVCLAAALAWGAVAPAAAQPKREQTWKRSDSAHFTFFYNGSEKNVRRLAGDLETLRALIGSLAPGGAAASPRPTYVYVFAGDKSYRPYYPIRDGKPWAVSSYFSPEYEANYVSVDGSGDVRKPAFTAYGFDFVGTHFANLPYWLHKGLAEYYGTFRASAKKLDVGRPDMQNLETLSQGGLIPMERIFSATRDSDFLRSDLTRRRFAAQAWATVHYLLHSPERQGQLDRYLQLLGRGVEEERAFEVAFQTPRNQFTTEVFGYIGSRRFYYGQLEASRISTDPAFSTRDVPWDEALARLGDLLAAQVGREADAEAHYRAALEKNPKQAVAHTGLGRLDFRTKAYAEAIEHFERAIEVDANDFRANLFLSRALTEPRDFEDGWMDELSEESRTALLDARAAAERCVATEPELAVCHSRIGYTYFWERDPTAGIRALDAALALQPAADWNALQLIRLLRNAGRPEDATKIHSMYTNRFNPTQNAEATRAIHRARWNAYYRALEAEDLAGAYAHLEAAHSATTDATEKKKLEEQMEWLRPRLEAS